MPKSYDLVSYLVKSQELSTLISNFLPSIESITSLDMIK